jgi:hypothetical protein
MLFPNENSVKGHKGREDKRRNENFTLKKNRREEMNLGPLRDLQFGKDTSNGKPEEITFEGFFHVNSPLKLGYLMDRDFWIPESNKNKGEPRKIRGQISFTILRSHLN